MKKVIPFTNDIKFNTRIEEISSISLEHNLNIKENNIVTGEFVVSGDYKMTDSSVNTEPFIYGLPFDITLDTKYDTDRMKIDIDDFNFEIINNEILRVNISVLIEGMELVEIVDDEELIEEIKPDFIIESRSEDEDLKVVEEEAINEIEDNEDVVGKTSEETNEDKKEERMIVNKEQIEDLFKMDEDVVVPVVSEKKNDKEVTSIFNNFSDKDEKYVTYFVHIVRDNDNLESICMKYKTTKEEISEYNDVEQITLGSKIIIPYNENESI